MPDCVMVARQTLTLFVWVRILVGQPKGFTDAPAALEFPRCSHWRGVAQVVARLVRDQEAVGSNPVTPTILFLAHSIS